ncbi:MAG: hypothetical protein MI785_16025 [Kiloniellales bacterium]|nr:hypothetical protein [Kiloniellales bacterium]
MAQQIPQVSNPAASLHKVPAASVAQGTGAQKFSAIAAYHKEAKDGDGAEEAAARAAAGRAKEKSGEDAPAGEVSLKAALVETSQTRATQAVNREGQAKSVLARRDQSDVSASPDNKAKVRELLRAGTQDLRGVDGAAARERQPSRMPTGKKVNPYAQASQQNEGPIQRVFGYLFSQQGWLPTKPHTLRVKDLIA